jgi:hypothetical protein
MKPYNGTNLYVRVCCSPGSMVWFLLGILVLWFSLPDVKAGFHSDVFKKQISLPRQQTTIYGALSQLSKQTGYFFIYDSELVNNDQRIRLSSSTQDLQSWLKTILDDPGLDYRIIENHILIYRPKEYESDEPSIIAAAETPDYLFIRGRVLDQESGAPLPYASIVIPEKGLGVASNMDGVFQFRMPGVFLNTTVRVSYMGFKSRTLPIELLVDNNVDIILETDYISMQEVIIRHYDPKIIVREALAKRDQNYSNEPVYHINFYREGIIYNNKLLNYSEAIFKVFKSGYRNSLENDQVMLLKSRNISNTDHTDTLIMKIRAGVRSALELDIMKTIPVFLDVEYLHEVEFTSVDLVTIDSKMVYAIEFEQIQTTFLPIYKGILYIDMESLAILKAEFEVHPKYINKSKHLFLVRQSRRYNASFDRIRYSVSYQEHNGRYHLSHVRGDIEVRFRPRNRIFSRPYYGFLEMAVSRIDDQNVSRFSRRETMRTNTTFADENFGYDYAFWGEYNIIPPEQKVTEALNQIRSKIESIIPEE